MTRSLRMIPLVCALGLFVAPGAMAVGFPPCPATSSCPNWLFVVEMINFGANPDPTGKASVIVRDCNSNPMANVLVTLDFSACCDIVLCDVPIPGQVVNCSAMTISGVTNAAGVFMFTAVGASKEPGKFQCPPFPGCGSNGVSITANDGKNPAVKLCNVTAPVFDLNGAGNPPGSNGLTISDVAAMFTYFGEVALCGGGTYRGRADYTCDGQITIADVAALFTHFGFVTTNHGVGCPGANFCPKPTGCP